MACSTPFGVQREVPINIITMKRNNIFLMYHPSGNPPVDVGMWIAYHFLSITTSTLWVVRAAAPQSDR